MSWASQAVLVSDFDVFGENYLGFTGFGFTFLGYFGKLLEIWEKSMWVWVIFGGKRVAG